MDKRSQTTDGFYRPQINTDCEPLVQIKSKYFFMLRDYQIEICERVRKAFARHRSVMVQMPTGTGKTVVLAEIVKKDC